MRPGQPTAQAIRETEAALAAGDLEGAHRAAAAILAHIPGHVGALNTLGRALLAQGDATGAERAFEQATAGDPRDGNLWFNLAVARRLTGDPDGELTALAAAIDVAPDNVEALLRLADRLQAADRTKHAARLYADAIAFAESGAESPRLQQALRRVEANRERLRAFIEARLSRRDRPSGSDPAARFDASLEILLETRRAPTEQPTFVTAPYLPVIPFHPREDCPWLADIEAAFPAIRAEAASVMGAADLTPYVDSRDQIPHDPAGEWAALAYSIRWGAYHLIRDGEVQPGAATRCPRTLEALAQVPQPQIDGFAPNALFSVLQPGARIPPHNGMTNARLICHLGLVVPEGCALKVGGETRAWREGEAFAFNDAIEHEAWNASDRPRAVLLFDTWRPELSPWERARMAEMIAAYREYHEELASPTPGL